MRRQLAGESRLSRALQARQKQHRGMTAQLHRGGLAAEQLHQLFVNDLHELLAGLQAAQHLGADRFVRDALDEVPRDLNLNVRFQQCATYLAHRLGDIVFGQPGRRAHLAQDAVQPFRQDLEHRASMLEGSEREDLSWCTQTAKTNRGLRAPQVESRRPAARRAAMGSP